MSVADSRGNLPGKFPAALTCAYSRFNLLLPRPGSFQIDMDIVMHAATVPFHRAESQGRRITHAVQRKSACRVRRRVRSPRKRMIVCVRVKKYRPAPVLGQREVTRESYRVIFRSFVRASRRKYHLRTHGPGHGRFPFVQHLVADTEQHVAEPMISSHSHSVDARPAPLERHL